MDVANASGLAVGVMCWGGRDLRVTVIVKATFTLASDGVMPLAAEQEPLQRERPALEGEADELERGADFVPFKELPEILMVGAAHPVEPSALHRIRFSASGCQRVLYAVSSTPLPSIPLVARYLRADPMAEGRRVRVGARPTAVPIEHAADADLADFNVAPDEQLLGHLSADGQILLEGLLAGAPLRSCTFPGLEPWAYYGEFAPGRAPAGPTTVPLRCDTLTIDATLAIATLVWRGTVPLVHEGALAVALRKTNEATAYADMLPRLAQARWHRAEEYDAAPLVPAPGRLVRSVNLTPPVPAPSADDPDAMSAVANLSALPFAAPALPFQRPHLARLPAALDLAPAEQSRARPPAAPAAAIAPEPVTRPALAFDALPLARYAHIKADLLAGDASRVDVLTGHGIDERSWHSNERHMAIRLARDASEGKGGLAAELQRAIALAQQQAPRPARGDEDLDRYIALRAEIDEAEEPAAAMHELGLGAGEWATMRRTWSRRCLADRELAERVRVRLAEARGALRKQNGA